MYWKYDVLAALKGLAEVGRIDDPRCHDALEQLETKRLPDGGWPAEGSFWKGGTGPGTSREHVSWGPISKRRLNEWVTADALAVRTAAGID